MVKAQPIQHETTAVVYSTYSLSRKCQKYEIEILAKLRTEKCIGLRAYKSLSDGPDLTCPLCNQEPQDL